MMRIWVQCVAVTGITRNADRVHFYTSAKVGGSGMQRRKIIAVKLERSDGLGIQFQSPGLEFLLMQQQINEIFNLTVVDFFLFSS